MRRWWGRSIPAFPRAASPRQATRPKIMFGCAAGVLVLVICLMAWLLWDARQEAWRRATQASENIASALEHDIDRNIELFDLSLQAVVDGLRIPGIEALDPELRNQVLFDRAATARYLGPTIVLDESGKITTMSRNDISARADFSGHRFFEFHRERQQHELYISNPFVDPLSGAWVIALSRRLERPDGGFAGVVFGTLRLDFFSRLFSRIDIGPDSAISLFYSDGALIFRYPFDPAQVGRDGSSSKVFPNPGVRSGTFEAASVFDGIDRFYAFRRIGELPLILTVGMTRATVFAEWERKAAALTISMLGLSAMIVMLGLALIVELRRRSQAERTALESGRRYRLLAEHSCDMIVRFEPRTGRRLYVSPASVQLYGYRPEEMVGSSIRELIHPDDLATVGSALEQIEAQDHLRIAYRGRRREGDYVWVEASLTRAQNPDTGAVEIIAIVRDIGERVRYEAALRQAKQQADAANRSKSEFLATMSHELRTPLNAIIGFTEIMQQEVMGPIGNPQYKTYVTDIHLSGTHLLALINEILDLTKAEAGKLELLEDVFDLTALVRSVVRLSTPRIAEAGLTAEIEVPPDLPLLRADERKTKQVLFNLIGNAAKFTPEGGTIVVSARFDDQAGFTVAIADTGIGIATEDFDRVLEPFAQIDSSLARRHNGTGLGLPVVKAIMELHRGRLELDSTLGVGTTVTVVFPPDLAVVQVKPESALSAA